MGKKQHSGVLNYGWKYMVDNLEYFRVRDRKIANVWSSYGLQLDDRWLGGGGGDFRLRDMEIAID